MQSDESVIKTTFFQVIKDFDEFLRNAKKDFQERYQNKSSPEATINDFDQVRTLGIGNFGRVILVKHKHTGSYYAMKMVKKKKIIEMKQLHHMLNEKLLLQSIRFPFLVYLEFCLKDNSHIYFIMPFITGGEMFTYLRDFGKFDESHSKFYAAQVIMGLEYLHYLDVIYRGLKPENLLIDVHGYLKITDMGFCKIVKKRTWTLCGTPEYFAPEIILSKGYGKSADWWSFGVLLYEMSAGYPPFHARDPIKMYENIVLGKYNDVSHFSSEIKDLIHNMLQVDLSRRYGNLKNGVNDIKSHNWFRHVDWLGILNRKVDAPFIPNFRSTGDTSNYRMYEEPPLIISNVDNFKKKFALF